MPRGRRATRARPQRLETAVAATDHHGSRKRGDDRAGSGTKPRGAPRARGVSLGKPLDEMANPIPKSAFCQSSDRGFAKAASGPSWNGWAVTAQNTRFQPAGAASLPPEDVPKLKLKWAFGFPGATSASEI